MIFILLFAGSYFLVDGAMMRSRSSDLVFFGYDQITPKVNFRRNTAIGPQILKSIMNNKITNTSYYILEVFFAGISLDYLFFTGDKAAIYTTTFSGIFFMSFIFFYFLGFINLGKIAKRDYFYPLIFIPVALVPSLINIDYISITIRSILATVIWAYIIALGILLTVEYLDKSKKYIKYGFYSIFIVVFSIEIVYFSYNYFMRRPVTMFESFFQSEKQIASYLLSRIPNPGSGMSVARSRIGLYDDSPKNVLTAYIMLKNNPNMTAVQKLLSQGQPYNIDGIILNMCPNEQKKLSFKPNTILSDSCLSPENYNKLVQKSTIDRINFTDFSLRTAYFIFK
jgi:hypothetical protein